jgi:DNA-directed RNA polymerase subunit RPC12/RpoP
MRVICFLRDLGLSINSIGDLLSEEHPERVIDLLLSEQEREVRAELEESKDKLEKIRYLRREAAGVGSFSLESIGDIATVMQNKKKLFKVRPVMIAFAVLAELVEIATVALWILEGIWWPFAVGMPVAIALCLWLTGYYYKRVAYICPACHKVFRPKFWSFFNAFHTPNTRKLTCPACGHKGYCVETHVSAADKEEQA